MRWLLPLLLISSALAAQTPQRRQGDWVVKATETVENQSIILAGNLIVEGTGNLTLNNVTLLIERKTPGVYAIRANSASTLTITNSTIGPAEADVRFDFHVQGAKFTLRKSKVEGLNDLDYPFNGGGLFLTDTVGAVIEDNTINHSGTVAGVQLSKCRKTTVRNNVITTPTLNNAVALRMQWSHEGVITGNRFIRGSLWAGGCHNNQITDNELQMTGESPGVVIFPGSAYNVVARNRFFPAPDALPMCFAVRVVGAPYPNYILDNTVSGNRYAFLISYSGHTVVAGNKLHDVHEFATATIHIHHSHDVKVLNNEIDESSMGILLMGSPRNEIRGNRVSGAEYGVLLLSSSDNVISGNVFDKNADNVIAMDSRSNRIEGNGFHRGRARQAWDGGENTWLNNYWDDASGAGVPYAIAPAALDPSPRKEPVAIAPIERPAIVSLTPDLPLDEGVEISTDTVWENCEKQLRGGISVQQGVSLTIRNCKITPAPGSYGGIIGAGPGATLQILNSTIEAPGLDSTFDLGTSAGGKLVIRDSKIRNFNPWTGGIAIRGDQAVIENNEITGNYAGIVIEQSKGHRIVNNRISASHFGINSFESFTDTVIENNVITNCFFRGMDLGSGGGNRIVGNRVEGALSGITIGGDGNLVRGNVLRDNAKGLEFNGTGNTVYENSFIGNGRFSFLSQGQTPVADHSRGAGQVYSQGGRGNYWDEYTGSDFNGDGIGDVAHNVGSGITDPHPLMAPPASATCSYVLGQVGVSVTGQGGAASFDVLGGGNCAWTAASQANWITLEAAAGAGPGRVVFRASPNPSSDFRRGTILVAGQLLNVDQAPKGCSYSISPGSKVATAAAGTGRVTVNAPAGCPWTAGSESGFIFMMSGPVAGSGNGEVEFGVDENKGSTRAGTVRIAGQPFKLIQLQAGAGAMLPANAIVNAASGLGAGGLAPGTFASIFGAQLGEPSGLIAGAPQRGLGGTRVFFNDTEAFLTFANWNQLNVLVPNGLEPGKTAQVRVDVQGVRGQTQALPIATASPGIFTMNGAGTGQAVVINQDGTINSAGNPAAPGSIVTFFATGYGVTDPASTDGIHPSPPLYPKPVQPLAVVFEGYPAPQENIYFAGTTYTGVLQVNVKIPATAATGERVALAIRFACGAGLNCDSQPNVWLAVKSAQ